MYEHIKICIFLFLYFQNVVSYKIYQLDSAEGTKLLPKIRQILLNQRHGEPEYQNQHVRHAKREQPWSKPVGESVFVKRIIPHGYNTGEYEYDSKLNTVFKPLARYHVEKPIEGHKRSVLKDIESEQKQKHRSDKDLIVLVQKEQNQVDLLSQIQKLLNHNRSQKNRKKKKGAARFRGLFNQLGKNALLMLRDKSGEDHDLFAHGKLPMELQQSGSSEEPDDKTVFPTYPFWNYWTYQKNIYQDRCPGNLIKVGNMCISSTGHRRYAHPSQTRRSSRKHKSGHSIRSARKKHLYGSRT